MIFASASEFHLYLLCLGLLQDCEIFAFCEGSLRTLPDIRYITISGSRESVQRSVLMKTNAQSLMNAANYQPRHPDVRKVMAANYEQITPCLDSALFPHTHKN